MSVVIIFSITIPNQKVRVPLVDEVGLQQCEPGRIGLFRFQATRQQDRTDEYVWDDGTNGILCHAVPAPGAGSSGGAAEGTRGDTRFRFSGQAKEMLRTSTGGKVSDGQDAAVSIIPGRGLHAR